MAVRIVYARYKPVLASALLALCQAAGAVPATNSLSVTVASHQKADQYLTSCRVQLGDKKFNCLARVRGNGAIETPFVGNEAKSTSRGILPLGDYRVLQGKQWFFMSQTDARGIATWQSCNLGGDGKAYNCFAMKWLDAHDMLVAGNGDRIYMFYVPRVAQRVWFTGKALDLVLRRVNDKNQVVWEWTSADHDVAEVREPPRVKGLGSEFASRVKQIRTSFLTNLGVSGDDPLCITIRTPRCMHMHWVDYLHANSLAWDRDGGIVVSARNINTIFKIDYPSGDVAWRLGGYQAQRSDFALANDPLNGFSYQHSANVLPNGNLLLFDNGNNRPDRHSRAAEYRIDMEKKTATLVWSYAAVEEFAFRNCCGLAQRLTNGNTLIAWGGLADKSKTSNIPVATEVTPDGRVVFELRSSDPVLPYRVWKLEK